MISKTPKCSALPNRVPLWALLVYYPISPAFTSYHCWVLPFPPRACFFFNICGPLSISPHQPGGLVSPFPPTHPNSICISKPKTFLMEWLPEDFHKKGSDSPWRPKAFGRTEGRWENGGGISRKLISFTISSPVWVNPFSWFILQMVYQSLLQQSRVYAHTHTMLKHTHTHPFKGQINSQRYIVYKMIKKKLNTFLTTS